MKLSALIAVAGLSAGLLAACSETPTQPTLGQKTMGDEGKLPATKTLGSQVPTMGTAEPTRGPVKRMGDEGKLPATNTLSGQVPKMTTQGDQ